MRKRLIMVLVAVTILCLTSQAWSATVTWTPATNTLGVVLTNAEKQVLQRAIQTFGANAVKEFFENWLIHLRRQFAEQDGVSTSKQAQFDALPSATQQKILNLLQCGQDTCP